MSMITTHVLDTGRGRPASGMRVRLFAADQPLGEGVTDADGRVAEIGPESLDPGVYQLVFDVAAYDADAFFPEVVLTFRVADGSHHHVPLLLSPFSYSTYRGS